MASFRGNQLQSRTFGLSRSKSVIGTPVSQRRAIFENTPPEGEGRVTLKRQIFERSKSAVDASNRSASGSFGQDRQQPNSFQDGCGVSADWTQPNFGYACQTSSNSLEDPQGIGHKLQHSSNSAIPEGFPIPRSHVIIPSTIKSTVDGLVQTIGEENDQRQGKMAPVMQGEMSGDTTVKIFENQNKIQVTIEFPISREKPNRLEAFEIDKTGFQTSEEQLIPLSADGSEMMVNRENILQQPAKSSASTDLTTSRSGKSVLATSTIKTVVDEVKDFHQRSNNTKFKQINTDRSEQLKQSMPSSTIKSIAGEVKDSHKSNNIVTTARSEYLKTLVSSESDSFVAVPGRTVNDEHQNIKSHATEQRTTAASLSKQIKDRSETENSGIRSEVTETELYPVGIADARRKMFEDCDRKARSNITFPSKSVGRTGQFKASTVGNTSSTGKSSNKKVVRGQGVRVRKEVFEKPKTVPVRRRSLESIPWIIKHKEKKLASGESVRGLRDLFETSKTSLKRSKSVRTVRDLENKSDEETLCERYTSPAEVVINPSRGRVRSRRNTFETSQQDVKDSRRQRQDGVPDIIVTEETDLETKGSGALDIDCQVDLITMDDHIYVNHRNNDHDDDSASGGYVDDFSSEGEGSDQEHDYDDIHVYENIQRDGN